jgi:hypothetical protein
MSNAHASDARAYFAFDRARSGGLALSPVGTPDTTPEPGALGPEP